MQGTILFNEVYETITSGEAFDAAVVSCDRKRGTGGKLVRLEGWMICSGKHETGVDGRGGAGPTGTEREARDPRHDLHGTVNVFNPANSEVRPRTIHWDLIRIFNGKRVIN